MAIIFLESANKPGFCGVTIEATAVGGTPTAEEKRVVEKFQAALRTLLDEHLMEANVRGFNAKVVEEDLRHQPEPPAKEPPNFNP